MEPFGIVLTFAAIAGGLAVMRVIIESSETDRRRSAPIPVRARFREGQYREYRRGQANDA